MQYGHRWNPHVALISKIPDFSILNQISTSEAEKRPIFWPFWPLFLTRPLPPDMRPFSGNLRYLAIKWWWSQPRARARKDYDHVTMPIAALCYVVPEL